VHLYNQGFNLNLTKLQEADLVAFLRIRAVLGFAVLEISLWQVGEPGF
jgi:hypothetical protein